MRKPKIGDVYSIATHPEVRIQYIGDHPLLGETIALLDYNDQAWEYKLKRILFYPVALNCRKQNLKFIEEGVPIVPVPRSIRRAKIVKKGVVESWYIDEGETTRETVCLTPEEMALPDGGIISHLVFLDWIEGNGNYMLGNYR